jgi:hypothetical protein
MVLIALAGGATGAALLLAGRFVGAVATPLFNVNALSLRQARVSDAIIGRVNATFLFIDWGPLPLGSLIGGIVAGMLGPRPALAAAAICGVIAALWIHASPAARLTSLTEAGAGAPVGAVDSEDGGPALEPPLVA